MGHRNGSGFGKLPVKPGNSNEPLAHFFHKLRPVNRRVRESRFRNRLLQARYPIP
jgi:hypothetical protein